ncbi:MAG TPA: nitroreductase family protein [Dehalococcoidia bacterium]|nr:nitroreductase family protein [Dehalococcoidia bacterium]
MSIRSAIRRRISVRHYEPRPVPEEILQSVVKSGENSAALDGNIKIRFHLIEEGRQVAERMTYLIGARFLFGSSPHFIIATSEEKPLFMVNMGFRMEQMILFATGQGLGTCWIGGLFIEERIGTFLGLEKDERVIALTPIGYPDTSFYGRIIHSLIHLGSPDSRKRKPLDQIAFGSEWASPLDTRDSELLEALECARLAPSWVNVQPWRFLVNGREIIAVADARGRYNSVRDGKHYYRLDVGIAMAHFFLVAKEIGWDGRWHVTGFDAIQVAKAYSIPQGYEVLGIYRRQNTTM